MANEFYYPWYPAHYRRDAGHLDHVSDSCYRRLIDWYMETGEPIKKDVPKLMHIMGVSASQFQSVWPQIEGFFSLSKSGYLHHKRCDIELDRQDNSVKQKSAAGIRSAAKRKELNEQLQLIAIERSTHVEQTFNGPSPNINKLNVTKGNVREDIYMPDDFAAWYLEYPRKVGRGQAERAFKTAITKTDVQTLIAGARRYRTDPNRKDQFTKHPATWLNGECWADELLPENFNGKVNGHSHTSSGSGFVGLRAEARQAARERGTIDD